MNLSTLIEKVTGKQRGFQIDYHSLVRRVADGKELDPELVARALQDAGKTTDDLQRAVDLVQRRRDWCKAIDHAQAMEKDRAAVRRQIDEADRALAEAERLHTETTNPLYWQLEDMTRASREGEEAKRQLQATCSDSELLGALADVHTEQHALGCRRHELTSKRDELNRAGKSRLEQAACIGMHPDAPGLRDQGKRLLAQAKEHAPELSRLEKRLTKLEQEEKTIREKMLEP